MIDITAIDTDMRFANSNVPKAVNVLSVQVGDLEYEPDFGVDLKYFLSEEFTFQNESFRAYLLQRLAANSINVLSVTEVLETLYATYTFNLRADSASTALMR